MRLEPVTLQGWADEVRRLGRSLERKLHRAHEADDMEPGSILRELVAASRDAERSLRLLAQDRREDARERRDGVESEGSPARGTGHNR